MVRGDRSNQAFLPVDLAVKSLPLCILEHCWSLQIIRKTQEAYLSAARSTHHLILFLCGLPPPRFLILLHQQGHVRPPGDRLVCVWKNLRMCLRWRKTHHLVWFLFLIIKDSIMGCLVIMAWCGSRQALRCKELWDCIINEAPGK